MGTWNVLVINRDKAKELLKKDPENESLKDIARMTEMYLGQINTASGRNVYKEAERYLETIQDFIKYARPN